MQYKKRLLVEEFKTSRTQKRVIRNMNAFLNSNQKSSCQSSFSVPEKNQVQTVTDVEIHADIQIPDNSSNSQNMYGSKTTAVESKIENAAGDFSKTNVKRHSSEKARQKRIDRRIAKGKPFSRGSASTPPKDCMERIADKIELQQLVKNGKPDYVLKGNTSCHIE